MSRGEVDQQVVERIGDDLFRPSTQLLSFFSWLEETAGCECWIHQIGL